MNILENLNIRYSLLKTSFAQGLVSTSQVLTHKQTENYQKYIGNHR